MVDCSMTGVYPIIRTPYDARGRIDEEDLRREVDWAIECGVDGLGIAVASDIFKLTEAERDLVLKTVVDQALGRVKVVMHAGAAGTDVAVFYSRRAEELGADGLMVPPPAYLPAHPDEVVRYFKAIAEAVNLPVFMQDQPATPMSPGLAAAVSRQHENLCYVKIETPPTIPRVVEMTQKQQDGIPVIFGGYGGLFLFEEVRRGAVGTMPGFNMPDVFVRVWRMWHEGAREEAEREYLKYAAFLRTMGQAFGIGAILSAHVLVRRGIIKSSHVRGPALPPDELQVRQVDRLLEELGLATR